MLENQKKEIKQKLELEHQRKINKLQIQNYNQSRSQQTELVEKHQLIMDQRLADLKSEIQAGFEVKRQELLKENSINDMAFSAQERVLNEIDVVKQRI